DSVTWLMTELGDIVFQPLAWVALAAIVYVGISVSPSHVRNPRMARARAAVTAKWAGLPKRVRTVLNAATGDFQERWLPIAGAIRLVWAAGPLTLGIFLLAYAAVHAAGEWLAIGLMR